jgi:hypothetical protein
MDARLGHCVPPESPSREPLNSPEAACWHGDSASEVVRLSVPAQNIDHQRGSSLRANVGSGLSKRSGRQLARQRMLDPGCFPCSSISPAGLSLPYPLPRKAQLPQGFAHWAWGFVTATIRRIPLRMAHSLRSLGLARFTLQAFSTAISIAYPCSEGGISVSLSPAVRLGDIGKPIEITPSHTQKVR